MRNRDGWIDSNFALILGSIILIVLYGSLYPFHFHSNPDPNGPLLALINTWRRPVGRGDFLANVLLYLPIGLFSVPALRPLGPFKCISIAIFFGLALSAGIELLQFYDEGRISALADVYADTIGVAVGSAAGAVLFGRESSWWHGTMDRRPFTILLLSCWLGYRLFPFVPVIDLHKYWTAVKPLVHSPVPPPLDLYRHIVIWLAVALVIEALFGRVRSRVVLPALVLFVLFARILIVDIALSPAEVAGGALAVALWQAFLARSQTRASVIAVLFAGLVAIEALRPFQFSEVARPFEWIPFTGFMHGSVDVNLRSFLEKVFTYGVLTWLIVRAGYRLSVAVGLSSGLVLCLRLSQVFLPGRSAEITDPIMVLIVAAIMKSVKEDPTRSFAPNHKQSNTGWWHRFLIGLYEKLVRNDSPQAVDLIYVMAGRMERKRYGIELYRAGMASKLLLSVGRFEVSRMAALDLAVDEELKTLRDRIPPEERHFYVIVEAPGIRVEKAALPRWSTYGEALAFRQFLEREKASKIMVVSTDVHLRRVAMTFANIFRGVPIAFIYCPVPVQFGLLDKEAWWIHPNQRRFVIKEMLKLAGYRLIFSGPGWAINWLMRVRNTGR